jgi:hypothetical protein
LLGDRHLVTPNDPNGLALIYYLKEQAKEKVTLTIAWADGRTLRAIEGTNKAGINRAVLQLGDSGPQGQLREIPPGEYDVTLQVGDKKFTQKTRVLP